MVEKVMTLRYETELEMDRSAFWIGLMEPDV
jgi:hypothetical protein